MFKTETISGVQLVLPAKSFVETSVNEDGEWNLVMEGGESYNVGERNVKQFVSFATKKAGRPIFIIEQEGSNSTATFDVSKVSSISAENKEGSREVVAGTVVLVNGSSYRLDAISCGKLVAFMERLHTRNLSIPKNPFGRRPRTDEGNDDEAGNE